MKKIISILFLFIAITSAKAQNLTQNLSIAFDKFIADEQLKYATVSFSVLNSETGAVIFNKNEQLGVAPASTFKTITSATALAFLGQDFTYKTTIAYQGNIQSGVLNGDLIIRGNGDPTLGSNRWEMTKKQQILNKILLVLRQNGITKIKGKIIADASEWDTQSLPIGWIWQDIGNYYGAGTSALCWGENMFELEFKPTKLVGGEVNIKNTTNLYPFLTFFNELKTGDYGTGDNVYAYSAPYTTNIYLRGTYATDLNKKIGLSLPNPALALAFEVSDFLRKNEIANDGFSEVLNSKSIQQFNLKNLTEITSPPLKEIIYWLNQKSINLYAEQLLRTLGAKFGKSASIIDGVKTVQKFWKNKGIDEATLNVVDGSGLSPEDRITTYTMAKVLFQASKEAWFPVYLESIPTHNNMKMKSGTISHVLGYAGYANFGNKQPICFSLIINNYQGSIADIRQKMFNLLNQLK